MIFLFKTLPHRPLPHPIISIPHLPRSTRFSYISSVGSHSLHLAFEILPVDQIRNIVVIVVVVFPAVLFVAPFTAPAAAVLFLQALVALGKFTQRGQTVGPKLV